MTFFPSSELLLDPSPLRVSDTVPGQLARSTARELALQRSRAPRPFATRGASPGAAGFALAVANEAWNLLLQQDIDMPDQQYPVNAPAGAIYRITGSITWQRLLPVPFDVIDTVVVDTLFPGVILSVGVQRRVVTFAGGSTAVFSGIGVIAVDNSGVPQVVNFGERNLEFWRIVSLNSLNITRQDTPTVPLLGGFPAATQPQPSDTPNGDLAFPISLPGGIPGLFLPTQIPVIILQPHRLGERPVPIGYPLSLPAAQREALPQIWLTPTGIQVGQGSPGDIVITTTPDTIPRTATPTQTDDLRQRIPPPVVVCNDEPPAPSDCCSCEEIRDIVFEELDKKFPPKRPFTDETVPIGVAEARTFVLPEFTQWVELTIVTPPPNRRMQSGGVNGQPVYYNGWYSYGITGSTSERKPIHYDFMSIPIPPGIESFTYTIYSGGTASGRIGYRQPPLF